MRKSVQVGDTLRVRLDTLEELEAELLELRYSNVSEIIEHERAHFNALVELGYTPVCGYEGSPRKYHAWVAPRENYKSIRDMIKVHLAPKNPNKADKLQAIFAPRLNLDEMNLRIKIFLDIFDTADNEVELK